MTKPPDLPDAVGALNASVQALSGHVANLTTAAGHQRWKTRALAASLVVDVALTLGLTFVIHDGQRQSKQLRDSICPPYAGVASLPIPASATESGRSLFESFRSVYNSLCAEEFGPLPPPATFTGPPPTRPPSPTPTPTR